MDSSKVVNFQRGRSIPAGLKALAVVIALGTIALVADHAFFIAPHTAQATSVQLYLPANMQTDGFALPADIKPTEGDVASPPATF